MFEKSICNSKTFWHFLEKEYYFKDKSNPISLYLVYHIYLFNKPSHFPITITFTRNYTKNKSTRLISNDLKLPPNPFSSQIKMVKKNAGTRQQKITHVDIKYEGKSFSQNNRR